jgi:hypothetical protein
MPSVGTHLDRRAFSAGPSRSAFAENPLAPSGDFSLTAFVRKILFAVIHHVFSDHGQSFPLISFLPFKAIFDIYCRNFQNEKRF